MLAVLYEIIREASILLGFIRIHSSLGVTGLIISACIFLIVGSMFRNKLWVKAFFFLLLNLMLQFVAIKSVGVSGYATLDFNKISIVSILIMTGAILCLIISLLYFYKLLRLENYHFKNDLRFKNKWSRS
jgi:hypothetical protein